MVRFATVILASLLATTPSFAALSIDRSVIVFEAGKAPRQDVMAGNSGATNLFLEVEVLEVTSPGTEQEQRQIVRDPESIGFVAAPRRLMVPPGGKRPVRLMNLNGYGDTERVYRVNVRPVLPPVEAEGSGVRIVVAYQVLVFVSPARTRVQLDARRDGNRLTLTNNGNVNALLTNGRQCLLLSPDNCVDVAGRRLYPGNSYTVELSRPEPVQFDVEAGGRRYTERF
jgi:P pilus assembly chaperone PapD